MELEELAEPSWPDAMADAAELAGGATEGNNGQTYCHHDADTYPVWVDAYEV